MVALKMVVEFPLCCTRSYMYNVSVDILWKLAIPLYSRISMVLCISGLHPDFVCADTFGIVLSLSL